MGPEGSANAVQKPTAKPSNKVAPESVVVEPETEAPAGTSEFTLADVGKHNSESNCWVIVHGKVYDVTPFLSKHPGTSAQKREANL